MNKIFSDAELSRIRDQAVIYQCACPAQVCVAIGAIRELYTHQVKCLNDSAIDRMVHERIMTSVVHNHAELEQCLEDILKIEGWDRATLKMPETLIKRLLTDN